MARGRMMMANNPDALRLFRLAMAVLEDKIRRLPTRRKLDRPASMAIVISGEGDHFATCAQPGKQLLAAVGGRVVHQVAQDDKLARLIFIQQIRQTLLDRSHPPERHQPAGRPLAELVAEV